MRYNKFKLFDDKSANLQKAIQKLMIHFLLTTIIPGRLKNLPFGEAKDINNFAHKIWYWCTNGSKSGLSKQAIIIIILVVFVIVCFLALDSSRLLSRKTTRSQRLNRKKYHTELSDKRYQVDDDYNSETHVPYRNKIVEFFYQLFR